MIPQYSKKEEQNVATKFKLKQGSHVLERAPLKLAGKINLIIKPTKVQHVLAETKSI